MGWLKNWRGYWKQAGPVGPREGLALLRDFPAWRRGWQRPLDPLVSGRPWLPFAATRFLARRLQAHMRVFEWGSGGSTLFLARRVAHVVSIEYAADWHTRVADALPPELRSQVELRYIAPDPAGTPKGDPADPALYLTSAPSLRAHTFQRYASAIDTFPEAHFHLFLIDGRARPSCLHHAIPKLAPGGWCVIDNTERPHYEPAQDVLRAARWPMREFHGPGPGLWQFWRTRFWQKPK